MFKFAVSDNVPDGKTTLTVHFLDLFNAFQEGTSFVILYFSHGRILDMT